MSRRGNTDILAGRAVSTGSVYSTILISTVIEAAATGLTAQRLVDVGCGDSPYRHLVRASEYVGIDRRPASREGNVLTGDAASLPLAGGVADAVLCTEVIEHVPDECALAAELARVAAPGAILVLSAPFVHGLHEQPYDFRRLTSIGLVTVLDGAGWQVDEIASIGGPVVVAADGVVRWSDSMIRRIAGRVSRKGSAVHRMLTAPSRAVQRHLAAVTLSRSPHFGPIDPMAPSPRLTLGYVVRATRRDGPAAGGPLSLDPPMG